MATLDLLSVGGDGENTSGSAGESAVLIHEIKPGRRLTRPAAVGKEYSALKTRQTRRRPENGFFTLRRKRRQLPADPRRSRRLPRGLAHFKEKGTNPQEVVDTRLAPDMLPLSFQ